MGSKWDIHVRFLEGPRASKNRAWALWGVLQDSVERMPALRVLGVSGTLVWAVESHYFMVAAGWVIRSPSLQKEAAAQRRYAISRRSHSS